MEFLGRIVMKEFKGFGIFEGVIESYDSSTGFFKIMYEDGDSEEADLSEVSRLLSSSSSTAAVPSIPSNSEVATAKKVGRKPMKWRRKNPGESSDNSVIEVGLDQLGQNSVNDFGDSVDANLNVNVNGSDGLDLNRGLNVEDRVENGEIRGCIDLNLSVVDDGGCDVKIENDDGGIEKVVRIERGFDLNLGINEEGVNGENENGTMDSNTCVGSGEELKYGVTDVADANLVDIRVCFDGLLERASLECVTPIQCHDGNSARRKRRKFERSLRSLTETVLRRSARRSKAAAVNEYDASSAMIEDELNDLSAVIDDAEEKPVPQVLDNLVEPHDPPPLIELPPSSANLNLEGIPVLDIFSVYACLRSFSTILYLSPFELEDLVAGLKSRISNQLIDFIHVAILQTLRKHLELLACEGCESASACLRNLNWDLLDAITWPVFMVEYLLLHGSGLKPGFSLNHLKLFDGEYYKKPAEVKIELLRCLCDDVVEGEAIRSELSKRTVIAEVNMEAGRTMCSERKRKTSLEVPADSCLSQELKEVADGNSDECCLCKMDGNLICCDGCPAAYHSKCVGIISNLLPEGNWYCPECVIGKLNFFNKPQKHIRGAELLGIDTHGRLFFGCFDYLLVSESCDAEALCSYYHKDDLGAITQLLQSSTKIYDSILSAISLHWAFPTDWCQPVSDLGGATDGSKAKRFTFSRYSGSEISEPAEVSGSDSAKPCIETKNLLTSSDGSGEVLQENELIKKSGRPVSNIARGTSGSKLSAAKQRKNKGSVRKGRPVLKAKQEDALQGQSGDGYLNSYSFARTASSVVEELLRKPSGKENIDVPKTEEEIISIQLKFISKKSTKSCWSTIQHLNRKRQIEKCGWCYCCRFPVEGRGCLFSVQNGSSVSDALKVEIDGVLSKRNKKGHLVDVICYVLCMEERLRGFLSGPWLRPQYSELWRHRVLKASDVSSLKLPLLTLEANLRPLALSADWWKHVDMVTAMGSASHFVASSRANSKSSVSRKKVRYADSETKSSTAGRGLVLFWWRGGMISRSLFNWKVIPRSLALKVARKAGCMKIPDVQYPDASEHFRVRRTKCVVWRASVEKSTSLEQLALQVREFDLFIRWDDIENTHPHSLLDKESIKSIRLFKKVIIRRKCVEGTIARYLLDFGKRRCIPDVVLKHGQKLEKSDCEKKKYWLDEVYVPLYLLKSFEERRMTRKAGKKNSSKFRRGVKVTKKPLRENGFDYLFSRAERADSYQCGHCNKNVLISEAVSCQLCNGYFHKRHVMKSSVGITSGCLYTCHRCRAGKHVKKESNLAKRKINKVQDAKNVKVVSEGHSATLRTKPRKKGRNLGNRRQGLFRKAKKVQYQEQTLSHKDTNVSTGITLRRSARKAKCTPLLSNSLAVGKKRKRSKLRTVASKETPEAFSWQKKRTQILHSFWINGLKLSRKPNEERVIQFKRRKLLVPSESSAEVDDQLKCSLCSQQGSKSALLYIACEICGDWFHGDAFGLNNGNIDFLIGFKCHVCRERSPPVCPFVDNSRDNSMILIEATYEDQDAQRSSEVVAAQKETECVLEFQCQEISPDLLDVHLAQDCDSNIEQVETLLQDSELRLVNGSSTSKEAVSCLRDNNTLIIEDLSEGREGQGLPEVVAVQKGIDCVLELQCNEGSSGLPEARTVKNYDGTLDQDGTPILDSEFRVEHRSPTSTNVPFCARENGNLIIEASNEIQDAQELLEVVAFKKETDCVLELQNYKGSSGLLEVHATQDCDGNLGQDEIPMLDYKLRVVNGSPVGMEVVSCSKDTDTLLIKDLSEVRNTQSSPKVVAVRKETGMVESQCNEGSSGLLEVDRTQNCDEKFDQDDAPMLGSVLRVENGSPTSNDGVSCSREDSSLLVEASSEARDTQGIPEAVAARKDIDRVLKLQCKEDSTGLLEVHTAQNCDANIHQYGLRL